MIRRLLALCLFLIVKALLSTLKIKREGDVIDRSGVVGFLHGEQLPLLLHRPQAHDLITPISLSKDGELQVMVMRWFGIRAVRGSTSRGGAHVLRSLMKWLKTEKGVALIALDGPRGPWGHISPGALYLAKRLHLPFWFCRVRCTRTIRLKSWDRFMIPYPFSTIYISTWECEPHTEVVESYLSRSDKLL